MTENHNRWEDPFFKGLTLLGFWNESEAISEAKKQGSIPLEESELCEQLGIPPGDLEAWLSKHWIEHNILAVMDGKDKCGGPSVSLIRQHDGARWDGFSRRRKNGKPACFQVRLFSPGNYADCPWPRVGN
jgi:hypothetical protein